MHRHFEVRAGSALPEVGSHCRPTPAVGCGRLHGTRPARPGFGADRDLTSNRQPAKRGHIASGTFTANAKRRPIRQEREAPTATAAPASHGRAVSEAVVQRICSMRRPAPRADRTSTPGQTAPRAADQAAQPSGHGLRRSRASSLAPWGRNCIPHGRQIGQMRAASARCQTPATRRVAQP